jgi:hypothetical protein
MIDIVGNNADHFSALWATTLKIFGVVGNNTDNYYNGD